MYTSLGTLPRMGYSWGADATGVVFETKIIAP